MDRYSWAASAEAVMLAPTLGIAYAAVTLAFDSTRARIAAFAAGELVLVAAFVTPLQTLALHYLLTAHLLQNVVVAEWAPALFVLALPPAFAVVAGRRRAVRSLTHPLVGLPLWIAVYFVWHVPAVYDYALEHPQSLLHVEHVSYLAAGVVLWWPVLQREPHRLATGVKAAYVFVAFVLASPLGLLLALLPSTVYDFYERAPTLWGLSHLADQEIAGITMASEQAVVFFALFVVYFARFMREQERAGDELARALK